MILLEGKINELKLKIEENKVSMKKQENYDIEVKINNIS